MDGYHLGLSVVVFLLMSEAQSQTYLNSYFNRSLLHNNSWINFDFLEEGSKISCKTELLNCLTGGMAWFLPNGTKLSPNGTQEINAYQVTLETHDIYCQLDLELLDGRAEDNPALSGVYECSISDGMRPLESVYLGLYKDPGGDPLEVHFSNISGSNPPFKLTFISIKTPATTVRWTLDDKPFTDANSLTVLSNPVTTLYTHTLTVTERLGGEYKCLVSSFNQNSINFFDYDEISIRVASSPPEVHAYQEGPTVINVRWDHPDPLNETIGYQIYYTGTTNGSLAADDIVSNNYTIAGLVNGGSYNISVAGKSAHLESSRTEAQENRIVLIPGAPDLILTFATADSVSFSWTVPNGSVVEKYDLNWSTDKQQHSDSLSGTMDRFTISGLGMYNNTTIRITLTAINGVGSNESTALTIHSDLLQIGSKDRDPVTNIGFIIGGGVAIFLIGLLIGIMVGIVVLKLIQRCKNRKKKNNDPATTRNLVYQNSDTGIVQNTTNHNEDPRVIHNLAYHNSNPATTQNMAYQAGVTYDYIT